MSCLRTLTANRFNLALILLLVLQSFISNSLLVNGTDWGAASALIEKACIKAPVNEQAKLTCHFRSTDLKDLLAVSKELKYKKATSTVIRFENFGTQEFSSLLSFRFQEYFRTYQFIRLNVLSSQAHPPTL